MTMLTRCPPLALAALTASLLFGLALAALRFGSAAALEVRAVGPLQVFEMDVDVDGPAPAPTEYTISVIVHRLHSGANPEEVGKAPVTAAATVPAGHTYTVAWSRGDTVECSTLDHHIADDHLPTIDGEFTATADATHEVCTQTNNGTIDIVHAPSSDDR